MTAIIFLCHCLMCMVSLVYQAFKDEKRFNIYAIGIILIWIVAVMYMSGRI